MEERHASNNQEVQILAVKYKLEDSLKNKLKNIGMEQQRDTKLKRICDAIRIQENPKYRIYKDVVYKICLLYTSRCV